MSPFKKNAITFGITFCISIIVFGIIAFILMEMFFGTDEKKVDTPAILSREETTAAQMTDKVDGNSFAFLLVGTDRNYNTPSDSQIKAASLIVVDFCCETGNVVYIPIPAVTLVENNGKTVPIGELYDKQNVGLLAQKAQGLTGINIGYYAAANLIMFERTLDTLGPVEYPVTVDMKQEDAENDYSINFKKGTTVNTAEDTIKLLRYKGDSYQNRIVRNCDYIRTLMKTYTSESYKPKASDMFSTLLEYIITDFEEDELMKYIDTIYKYSSFNEVTVTYPGTYDNESNPKKFTADYSAAVEEINEYVK